MATTTVATPLKLGQAPRGYEQRDQDQTRRLIEATFNQLARSIQMASGGDPKIGQIVRVVQARSTGTISVGATETGIIDIGTPSNVLMALQVDKLCWIRFYSNEASMDADVLRPRTTDPLAGKGVIGEFIITPEWKNVTMHVAPVLTLYNGDTPPGSTIRYRITNDEAVSSIITMQLTIVGVETELS